jgi:Fe-S-cluster containining protein
MADLKTRLPALYHDLLPAWANETYPDERFATCHDCVQAQTPASPLFATKCCAYYPSLPNYLAGGVLADTTAAGATGGDRLRAVIGRGAGVTPLGVQEPASYTALSATLKQGEQVRSQEDAHALLCPYYDGGACSIWAYREHLCSTYFCRSVGGEKGRAFWALFNEYLRRVERALAAYAWTRVAGLPAGAPPGADDAGPDWGDWRGREVEAYVACFREVSALDAAGAARLLDTDGRHLEERLRDALADFRRHALPVRVRLASGLESADACDGHVRLSADGAAVEAPAVAAHFLRLLDGRHTSDGVVRQAARVHLDVTQLMVDAVEAGVLRLDD